MVMVKAAKANWRTTLMGVVTLAFLAYSGYRNPAVLTQPGVIGQALAAVGLIAAKDAGE